MAGTAVGLDIGTHAVRAVELSFGKSRASTYFIGDKHVDGAGEGDIGKRSSAQLPTLQRFGQVALPFGAVVAGEVVDPAAVSAAIGRLWREAGFKAKNVIVGVSNQRVVARITQVPAMSDSELRSAVRFQVQELIPIPVEEAVLDYQVVERTVGAENQETLSILLVAAHREMLRALMASLEGAGLTASRIALVPLALIRAVHTPGHGFDGGDDDRAGQVEAIVGIGAGVTNIVVHADGMPYFVRTLTTGGNIVSEELASEMAVSLDEAEGLKRRADPISQLPEESRASQVVGMSASPLLEEIRGSLDYYRAQAGDQRLERVLITGGGGRLPELAERLGSMLGLPVEPARPLDDIQIGDTGFTPEVVESSADLLAVALGLALEAESSVTTVRRLTLLPPEIYEKRKERRQMALAGAGVAAVAALLMAAFLARSSSVDERQAAADLEESRTAQLQSQVAALAGVEVMQADVAARRQTISGLLANDVAWTTLLEEVSTVLPNDVWLTSFNGSAGDKTVPGSVDFAAMGFDQTSAARWLLRLGELDALDGLWLPSSTKSEGDGRDLITFSSTATLTAAAHSDRLARFLGEAGQ